MSIDVMSYYYFHLFRLRLSLHYDDLFLNHVANGNHSIAKHRIHEIVSLAGPIFQAKSWKLNHKIELVEKEISWVQGEKLTLKGNDQSVDIM